MNTAVHRLYLALMVLIVAFVTVYIGWEGWSYYRLPVEDRFFDPMHQALKSSGVYGHGFGIIGTLMMIFGVGLYMARKRMRALARVGRLKYWLEFHIFLCTLGPVLVLYHTAMKFGGIVSISFWSMVAVFLSGVAGRFIYIQIPRTIEGRELSLAELLNQKKNLTSLLRDQYQLNEESLDAIQNSLQLRNSVVSGSALARWWKKSRLERRAISTVKTLLKEKNTSAQERKEVLHLIREEINMNRKIERLALMQNLFKYWHVAHLPFAFVMLIIMIIHVVVTIVFGYRWIF